MENKSSDVKECPFCHSDKIKKMPNEKFDDMYHCEGCNHGFRYDQRVNLNSK